MKGPGGHLLLEQEALLTEKGLLFFLGQKVQGDSQRNTRNQAAPYQPGGPTGPGQDPGPAHYRGGRESTAGCEVLAKGLRIVRDDKIRALSGISAVLRGRGAELRKLEANVSDRLNPP